MKVIIIEDEDAHRKLMERSIKKEYPDAQIDCFGDIEQCLKFIDQIHPDIIITDYLLPGMNALDFLETLRECHKKVPVVVVTGQGDENVAVKAMKLGAWDYIVKSRDFFSLVPTTIEKVIRQKELKKELQKSKSLYEWERNKLNSILASMVTPLAVIDENMTINFVNPIFERIFGKGLIGKPWQAIFGTSCNLGPQCLGAINDRQIQHMEFVDIKGRVWHITDSPGREDGSDMRTAVLVFQDITKRKSYEQRLHHLSARMIDLQEGERSRISRDLHDILGQTLTALKFDAAWLKRYLSDEDTAVKTRYDEMCGLIDSSLDTVRRISADLRPGILDDTGLAAALEWYILEFKRRTGIESVMLFDLPAVRLPNHIETGIYRIVQEALTNVARHASASTVTISMKQNEDNLFVEILDDGMGIDTRKIHSPLSTGISSMRERTEILSGSLEIHSSQGKGTRVSVSVPIMSR